MLGNSADGLRQHGRRCAPLFMARLKSGPVTKAGFFGGRISFWLEWRVRWPGVTGHGGTGHWPQGAGDRAGRLQLAGGAARDWCGIVAFVRRFFKL